MVVAQGEQGLVDVEEPVGELVPHHHARLQGEEARVVLPAAPDVGLALGHVDLAERERHEGHVPRRAGPEPVEHVLVGVAGERAAVVPGHGEGAAVGHALLNDGRPRGIPQRSGLGPEPAGHGGQARSRSRRRRSRRRRGASSRRRGSTPPPPRGRSTAGQSGIALAEHAGGRERGAGVARREAARERPADAVRAGPILLPHRAVALEQALDRRRSPAATRRRGSPTAARRVIGSRPGSRACPAPTGARAATSRRPRWRRT